MLKVRIGVAPGSWDWTDSQGFFFENTNTVRIYRIYGMEVWDWEQSSYEEVGTHQIEWHYDAGSV